MSRFDNWIDIIRSPDIFTSIEAVIDHECECAVHNFTFATQHPNRPKTIGLPWVKPSVYNGQPIYVHATDSFSHGSVAHPHIAQPAAAQGANHITLIWSSKFDQYLELNYDDTVGMHAPANARTYNNQPTFMAESQGAQTGMFNAVDIKPHRTDGFPAVIVIGNLRKWYTKGQLDRKGIHPALQADYIGAMWMADGEPYRTNGPSQVLVEGYSEYHKAGNYQGYRAEHITYNGDGRLANCEPESPVNPLSNKFFCDSQDEMAFIAQNRACKIKPIPLSMGV